MTIRYYSNAGPCLVPALKKCPYFFYLPNIYRTICFRAYLPNNILGPSHFCHPITEETKGCEATAKK